MSHKVILITNKDKLFDTIWSKKFSRTMSIIDESSIIYSSGRGGHLSLGNRTTFHSGFLKDNTVLLEKQE